MSKSPPTAAGPEQFLRCVARSGLMTRDEIRKAVAAAGAEIRADAEKMADFLLKSGKLTRYQTNKLLAGTHRGLVLEYFRLLAPIGKGGMGTVFLARDERDKSLLALKVLPPKMAREEGRMLERFRREMGHCQLVAHPNIARTREVGELRGVHYIAMEYIPGKTLSRHVHDNGPMDVPRAARLMAEVAAALHHAHERGLIHRDLKPSNIQITPSDRAKVLDLGLAMVHGETGVDARVLGGKGYIVGTMDYIAPEQTEDAAGVDPRCDVYALGCTLYFALAGRPPFPGGTNKEKIQRHRRDLPDRLSGLRDDIDPEFVALVERMMAKEPDLRPATAAEAEEELRAWAGPPPRGRPVEAEEPADETVALRDAAGSSEFSAASLPVFDADGDDVPAPEVDAEQPLWVMIALGAAAALLVAGLALMGAMAMLRK